MANETVRAGSCFENAAAESFFSTVESKQAARQEVARFIDWYNRVRRNRSCEMKPPIAFEAILADRMPETGAGEEAA